MRVSRLVYLCNRNLSWQYRVLRGPAMLADALIHLLSLGFLGSSFQLEVIRRGTKAHFARLRSSTVKET